MEHWAHVGILNFFGVHGRALCSRDSGQSLKYVFGYRLQHIDSWNSNFSASCRSLLDATRCETQPNSKNTLRITSTHGMRHKAVGLTDSRGNPPTDQQPQSDKRPKGRDRSAADLSVAPAALLQPLPLPRAPAGWSRSCKPGCAKPTLQWGVWPCGRLWFCGCFYS